MNPDTIHKLREALITAEREEALDNARWENAMTGQDTEDAEASGYLAGYAAGLRAALKVIYPKAER